MTYRIGVTDCTWRNLEAEKAVLPAGFTIELFDCQTEEEVIACCSDCDAVIVEYAPMTKKVMQSLPKLKAVSVFAIGYDSIDVASAPEGRFVTFVVRQVTL